MAAAEEAETARIGALLPSMERFFPRFRRFERR